MTKYISELFNEFEKLQSRKAKVAFLQQNKGNGFFEAVLQGAFDPNIKWKIEVPDYVPNNAPIGLNPSNLFMEIPKCTIFTEGHPKGDGVKEKRLKEILIQILESMHSSESLLFEGMMRKNIKCKGLTEKMVLEVFPDLYRKV
jgi:hypothetical protein